MAVKLKVKGDKTDFEREIEREIEHDKAAHGKRKRGGVARGEAARSRHDRPRRQLGGVGGQGSMPARPDMGGVIARPSVGGIAGGTLPGAGRLAGGTMPGVGGQAGGMPPGGVMPQRVVPRPVAAAAPAVMNAGSRPVGFARGGRTNGQKWIPGQGVEDTDKPVKSRGDPILERAAKGGHITAAERRKLPDSDFALPGKGTGPKGAGPGSYPIDTPGRARSALSRSAQHASPSEQATIRRKVAAKYPSMEVGD